MKTRGRTVKRGGEERREGEAEVAAAPDVLRLEFSIGGMRFCRSQEAESESERALPTKQSERRRRRRRERDRGETGGQPAHRKRWLSDSLEALMKLAAGTARSAGVRSVVRLPGRT